MTDKELLELAAKAAGVCDVDIAGRHCVLVIKDSGIYQRVWNPLEDDGDALRLAVKLGLQMLVENELCRTHVFDNDGGCFTGPHNADPYAATRRAIVRAAAELGRGLG